MPEGYGDTLLRLTVRGAAGSVDLVVPAGADVESIGREYVAVVGGATPVLVSTTGKPLDRHRRLDQLGLSPGDVVVAVEDTTADPDPSDGDGRSRGTPPAAKASWPATTGVGFAAAAAVAGAMGSAGPLRTLSVGLLLLVSLVSAAVGRSPYPLLVARAMAAPAFAAAGGFLLVYSPVPGGILLAVTVGATAAAAVAALVRAGADARVEPLTRVWLVVAGAVGVAAALTLVAGAPARSLWAVLFAAAVVVARLLPYLVVDVPDETLLDLDRLAVTSWSARERPRGRRRGRLLIRPEGVAELVRSGRRLLEAGAVAVAVVASVTVVLSSLRPGSGIDALGVHLLLLFGGGALALTARSYRAAVPRAALRVPGALALVLVLAGGLSTLSGVWLAWALGGVAVVAAMVLVSAVSLGRGWRSIWWARTADVAESGCVVLCLAALPVAAGLFELVRQLPAT